MKLYISIFLHLGLFIFGKDRLYFNKIIQDIHFEEEKVLDFSLDKNGALWVGAENGLYQYTGDQFKKYVNSENDLSSISFNRIKRIYCDSKNRLWLGTSRGLNVFNSKRNTFKNYRNSPKTYLEVFSGKVVDIFEDPKDGSFWILEFNKGLFNLNEKTNKITYYPIPKCNHCIYSRFLVENNNIYITSSLGLVVFDRKNITFYKNNSKNLKTNCLIKFRDQIYVGHTEGLLKYNIKDKSISQVQLGEKIAYVSSIVEKEGKLLIGCDGKGIKSLNPLTNKIYTFNQNDESGLCTNNITSLYNDKNNILWVGTYMNGIQYSNYYTNYFTYITNPLQQIPNITKPTIKSICQDQNNITWIGTDRAGLYSLSKNGEYKLHENFNIKNLRISDFAITNLEWHKNSLYLSTYGDGLFIIDTIKKTIKEINTNNSILKTNNIKCTYCNYKNETWVGTYEFGIYKIDSSGNLIHFQTDKYNSNYILRIIEDNDNNIWFATEKGLVKHNNSNEIFEKKPIKLNQVSQTINDIIYNPKDNVFWIGTQTNGLLKYNLKTNKISLAGTNRNEQSNTIIGMVFDNKDKIWFTSRTGIFNFNLKTDQIESIIDNNNDNLSGTFTFNSGFVNLNGVMYFGTSNGLLRIDPKNYKKNTIAPPIIISSVITTNNLTNKFGLDSSVQKYQPIDSIYHLNYYENDIEISFSAQNFINPLGNKYKYKLKGLENAWRNESKNLSAKYTNLPPGNYEFEVHAANNDGIWNSKGKTITIIISPPWWKTLWFYGFCILATIGLFVCFYLYRLSSIKEKNETLQKEIDIKTKELSESNANLKILLYKTSHDVRGPLKSLSTLAQLGLNETTDDTSKTYLQHISNSSKKIEHIIEDLLTVTNPNLGKDIKLIENFEIFAKDAIESLSHIKGADRIKIDFSCKNNSTQFFSCPKSLSSIIQNLIENPIKYQDYKKKESYLKIEFNINDKEAIFTFEDNGIGIPLQSQDKIFDMFYRAHKVATGSGLGLYITKVVIDRLKGKIDFYARENNGCKFIVIIPNQLPN